MKNYGYLHDTLEDTDTTYEEIKEYFGIDVANYVKELTNDDKIKHDMGKSNYLKLKMLFMSPLAFKVKLCDRLDNVKDLVNSNSSQFMSRYINETLEIFNFLIFNRELDDEEYELVREILNNVKNLNNNYVRKLKIA